MALCPNIYPLRLGSTKLVDWHYIFGGAIVGFIVGATGVGGGSLMTPLLTLGFGIPAPVAVGTDLLFAATTKAGGAIAHARRGSVSWPITLWLAAGSVPAAIITLLGLHALAPDATVFSRLVTPTLGIALLLTAAALSFKAQIQALGSRLARRSGQVTGGQVSALAGATDAGNVAVALSTTATRPVRPLPTLMLGSVLGCLVTLTSVGAGALGVVALLFLYPMLRTRQIVGADIAHAVPLTLVAGIGHAALGTVDWYLLGALLIGSLPAISLGTALAHRLPEKTLRIALALMLVGVGLRLILS